VLVSEHAHANCISNAIRLQKNGGFSAESQLMPDPAGFCSVKTQTDTRQARIQTHA
jgi:hypothetical protein